MSKNTSFQSKFTRNDRFAQMSHQEKVIEQKKKEILAKLEAKQKGVKTDTAKSKTENTKQDTKSEPAVENKNVKNIFSNDGSFLDQFKLMKESKKTEPKTKLFNKSKELEKGYNDDRNKSSRWIPHRSPSPKERLQKRTSRFSSEKLPHFEQKITINTSFSASISLPNLDNQSLSITSKNVTGQPLLKNMLPQPISFPPVQQHTILQQSIGTQSITQPQQTISQQADTVISAPPVLLNVPPPQIVQGQISNTVVLNQTSSPQNVLVSTPLQPILTTVNIPPPLVTTNVTPVPPPCLPTVELASIPPPNPIQVQNIPQPEPLNALNIPQPAPIQVQNIPTPNSIQLNEIPNPKPLDLMAIPTPNEEQSMSDPDFIKNIPPPNKSIPPPQMHDAQIPLITTSIALPTTQNVLVPPPTQIQTIQNVQPPGGTQIIQQSTFSSVTVALPVGVVQVNSNPNITNTIPSLMAQPILPPPGMGINVSNLNCPPPIISNGNVLSTTATTFLNQPPPLTNHLPSMTIPPPSSQMLGAMSGYTDANTVFPPGSAEYEAMASLGRMVAECGQGVEDMVKRREKQDPNLWFLCHEDSAAYQQYRRMIEQFKHENELKKQEQLVKQEDIYEPETALEEAERVPIKHEFKEEHERSNYFFHSHESYFQDESSEKKRKRKSRWGDKETNIAPPSVIFAQNPAIGLPGAGILNQQTPMLSKITRHDHGLVQYAIATYGSANLTEEDWKKAEDNYKIHLLYQDMVKKREEVKQLNLAGKNKYEYDSDEDTEGGTWEHKVREKEMTATKLWAQELTRQAEGKHHIGDFLPPEEYKRFLEKTSAAREGRQPNFSDYKEFKIKEDNIGFKMLQKLGWTEGEGLGTSGKGIVEPINKATPRDHTQGLGLNQPTDEDEYESYRKRMMLAYRFRPNPLNNPRRPYY